MTWIAQPLTVYTLLAGGLLLCLYLFFSLKREHELLRRKWLEERQAVSASLEGFRNSLEHLRGALEENATPVAGFGSLPGTAASLHLTRRSQALRMHRRGESPEHIAAALQMPRGELELLLKLQQPGDGPAFPSESEYPGSAP
jgi:hypothetical protein